MSNELIRRSSRAVVAVAAALLLAGCQVPLGPVQPTAVGPVRLPRSSFPTIVVADGVTRMYRNTLSGAQLVPVTRIPDLGRSYTEAELAALTVEGMPDTPAFARQPSLYDRGIWEPTVERFGDRWVMWFTTSEHGAPYAPSCIGKASAPSPDGPFVVERIVNCGRTFSNELTGPTNSAGASSANLFTDARGVHWLQFVWLDESRWVRPNATAIWSVRLDDAGNPVGPAARIYGASYPWEAGYVGNPSMIYDRTRKSYLLAYSTPGGAIGIARCLTPNLPCTGNPDGAWLTSTGDRVLRGGLSFFQDGQGAQRAIYSSIPASDPSAPASASIMYLRTDPEVTLTIVK